MSFGLCVRSFPEVPRVQRQALCERVPASPWLSADDQDTGHSVHCWQVSVTHKHTTSSPVCCFSLWHIRQRQDKKLLVLLDLWLPGLHLMYTASIDPVRASITSAWHAVRDFSASLHVFLVFMDSGINLSASTNIVAANHLDTMGIGVAPLAPCSHT